MAKYEPIIIFSKGGDTMKTIKSNFQNRKKFKPMYNYIDSEGNSIWRPYSCYYKFCEDHLGKSITRIWDPKEHKIVYE